MISALAIATAALIASALRKPMRDMEKRLSVRSWATQPQTTNYAQKSANSQESLAD